MSREGVISEQDLLGAEITAIGPYRAHFDVANLALTIMKKRMTVLAKEPPIAAVPNVSAKLLARLDVQMPVSLYDFMHEITFHAESEDQWHAVGHRFAPNADWEAALGGRVGLTRLTLSSDSDDAPQHSHLMIEPGTGDPYPIHVRLIDLHRSEGDADFSAEQVLSDLEPNWLISLRRAEKLFDHLLGIIGSISG